MIRKTRMLELVNAVIIAITMAMMTRGIAFGSFKANGHVEDLSTLCQFYIEYDEIKNCGADGYPLRYGKTYCEMFSRRIGDFSRRGQAWLQSTLVCLQDELRTTMYDPSISCDSLNELAIDHHARCYVNHGFCELSARDKIATLSITRSEFFTSNFIHGVVRSSDLCGDRYSERLVNMDPELKQELEREIQEGIFDRHYLEMIYLMRSEIRARSLQVKATY